MNNYAPPLQGTANNLAQYGRYGDSMLVHMNPIEVQGIAALSPTGRLTTNPVTGQQEAFLPFLAPLLGSALGLNSLGAAALSGALTWAQTGDFKKGLLSGITGFGIGKIFGGLGDLAKTGTDAAGTAAGTVADAAAGTVADAASTAVTDAASTAVTDAASTAATDIASKSVAPFSRGLVDVTNVLDTSHLSNLDASSLGNVSNLSSSANKVPWWGRPGPKFGDEGFLSAAGKSIASKEAFPGILTAGISASELGRIEAQEALEAQMEGIGMGGEEARRKSEEEIARAYGQIAEDYPRPYSSYANSGGLVSLNPMDYQNKRRGLAQLTGEPVRMNGGGGTEQYSRGRYSEEGSPSNFPSRDWYRQGGNYTPNVKASEAQSALRGSQLISAPQMQALSASGYRPGFGPELQYFRSPDESGRDPFAGRIDPMNPNAPARLGSAGPGKGRVREILDSSASAGPGKGRVRPPDYVIQTEEMGATEYPEEMGATGYQQRLENRDQRRNDFYPDNDMGNLTVPELIPDKGWMPDSTSIPNIDYIPYMPSPPMAPPPIMSSMLPPMLPPGTRQPIVRPPVMQPPVMQPPIMQPPVMPPPIMPPPIMQPPVMPPPVMQPPIAPPKRKRSGYGRGKNKKYEGGLVKMQDMGQVPEMESGIASVDPAMEDSMAGIDPAVLQLAQQTAMAILGQVPPEQADAIIQAFIQQFGVEQFQALRQEVLNSIEPGAQNEGMIQGEGDGMSDEIMGSIGDQQRVAVSPGEYIVPADVVSGIGNGSSDAGAGELDSMMDEIRRARTGMTEQPPAIDPRGAMPV